MVISMYYQRVDNVLSRLEGIFILFFRTVTVMISLAESQNDRPLIGSRVMCRDRERRATDMRMTAGVRFLIACAGLLALSGCGKSVEAKREGLVRCGGYLDELASPEGQRGGFDAAVEAKIRVSENLEPELLLANFISLFKQPSFQMDETKAPALAQEGADLARTQLAGNDREAAVGFIRTCIRSYRELAAAP